MFWPGQWARWRRRGLARAAGAGVLRFVPQADLSGMDPVITTRQVVRNAGFLVWDMLYGIDADFVARPQMCEGHEVSADGLTWRFRLREGCGSMTGSRCGRRMRWRASSDGGRGT